MKLFWSNRKFSETFCNHYISPSLYAQFKTGFHTCVSKTLNSARCLSMFGHQCSQAIPAFTTKACVLAHVELLRGDARLVPRCAGTATYGNRERSIQKRFSVLRQKRARPRKYLITMSFRKSILITQHRTLYVIYIPPDEKDLAINITMVAYENRQNAIKSKQL